MEEKQLYGYCKGQTGVIAPKNILMCQRKWNIKKESISLRIAARSKSIMTNHIKTQINNTQTIASVVYLDKNMKLCII